jgi:hypothetical protein
VLDPLEYCDLGAGRNVAGYGDTGGCAPSCTLPSYCGDAQPDVEHGEQCDLGANNGQTGYPCTRTCKICVDC